MAFDPTTDSWAPGEPPVGNASDTSGFAPVDDKPTGSLVPQQPSFLDDVRAKHDKVSGALAGDSRKYTETTSVLDQMEQGRIERDRGRMDQAFNMESAAAHDPALNNPWNADKERSERIKGPLENFGSVGTIFALAASAFTRTPMTSALTAAGAAMTAMHQADEEGYKAAYDAWKSNTDLAVKRFNIERGLYEDANKLVSTDLNLWRQKRSALAAQFDDRKRQIMLDNGMDAEVLKADESYIKAGEQAIKYQTAFEDMNLEHGLAKTNLEQWQAKNPPPGEGATREEKLSYGLQMRAAEYKAISDAKRQVQLDKHPGLMTPEDRLTMLERGGEIKAAAADKARQAKIDQLKLSQEGRERLANLTADRKDVLTEYIEGKKDERSENAGELRMILAAQTAEDRAKLAAENRAAAQKRLETAEQGKTDRATSSQKAAFDRLDFSIAGKERLYGLRAEDKAALTAYTQDKLDERQEKAFEARLDQLHFTAEERAKLEETKQKAANERSRNPMGAFRVEAIRKIMDENPGMTSAEAEGKYNSDAKKAAPSMGKDGIELAANLLVKGNPAATTNVGRGVQGEANLNAIRNRAAEILKDKGLGAEQAAQLINDNTAAFMGDKAGARTMAIRVATIEQSAHIALATADRVIETSKEVSRTKFSDINKIIQAGELRTGDQAVVRYGIAVNTLINNYARAIGGSNNTLTNSARNEAHDLLQKYWSQGQIESAIDQMKKELSSELKGAEDARRAWGKMGITLDDKPAGAPAAAGVIRYDAQGNRI